MHRTPWLILLCLLAPACTTTPPADVAPDASAEPPVDAGIPDGCSVTGTLVSYDKPSQLPTALDDTRCDLDAGGHCTKLDLQGYLYLPVHGTAPYPILIDNHGSEPLPGDKCEEASYFAQRGYIVFVPHRRGHGKSTGVGLADYTPGYCSTPGQGGPCKMEYLHKQVDDVQAAIAYASGVADADQTRIGIMGHSFGGIVTMFSNEQNLGQRAVIDIAGSSQSWEGNPDAVAQMTTAAQTARAPVLYFEPLNDHSIHPTTDLPSIAGAACRQYESALLPAIDVNDDGAITMLDYSDDTDGDGNPVDPRDKAHGQTMKRLDLWGSMAYEFLQRYLSQPPQAFDHLCSGTSYMP